MDQGDEPMEEAKEASGHAESTVQSTEDSGSSRSFDCTFCKRGFSNAQALGGHMNIHRKERARLKPVRTAAAIEPFDASWYSYSRNQSFPPAAFSIQKNFAMYLPESTSGAVRPYSEDTAHRRRRRPQELRFFGPEASSGPRVRDDAVEASEEEREEGEVDLELRLGH